MATDAEIQAFLNRQIGSTGRLKSEVSVEKSLLGGVITGLGTVGGFVVGTALAPATGGLSFLLPLAGGLAGSFGAEIGKDLLAEENDLFRAIDLSEKAHPRVSLAGSFIPESLLIIPSVTRLVSQSALKIAGGQSLKKVSGDIAKEVGRGTIAGGVLSTGFQAGISATTTGQIRIDPLIVIGDAVLGGLTTKAPLSRGQREAFEINQSRLINSLPAEAKARLAERKLLRSSGLATTPELTATAKQFSLGIIDLERTGKAFVRSESAADEIQKTIQLHNPDNKISIKPKTIKGKTGFELEKIGEFEINDEILAFGSLDKQAKLIGKQAVSKELEADSDFLVRQKGADLKEPMVPTSAVRQKDFVPQVDLRVQDYPAAAQKLFADGSVAYRKPEPKSLKKFRQTLSLKSLVEYMTDVGVRSRNKFLKFASDDQQFLHQIMFTMEDLTRGKVPVGTSLEAFRTSVGISAELPKVLVDELAAFSKNVDPAQLENLGRYAELKNLEDSMNLIETRKTLKEQIAADPGRKVSLSKLEKEILNLEIARPRGFKSIDDVTKSLGLMERDLGKPIIDGFDDFLGNLRKILGTGSFDSVAVIAKTGQAVPKVKGILQLAIDQGYITQVEATKLLEARPNYSPSAVLGWLEASESAFAAGRKQEKSALQFMSEDTSNTDLQLNVLLNTEQYLTRFVQNIENNAKKLQLVNLRRIAGKGSEFFIQRAPAKGAPPIGMGQFNVREDGVMKRFFAPDEVVGAMKAWERQEFGWFVSMMSQPAQLLRASAVNYNPIFGAKNLVRDMLNAWGKINELKVLDLKGKGRFSAPGFVGKVAGTLPEAAAFITTGRETAAIRELREAGGFFAGQMSEFKRIAQESKKGFIFNFATKIPVLKQAVKFMGLLGKTLPETSELGVRLAVYKMMRIAGKNQREAAAISRSLLDYSVQGVAGRQINAVVPFFNAPIRGMANLIGVLDKAIKNPETHGLNAMLKIAATGLIPTLSAAIAAKKMGMLDGWLNESSEIRDNMYLFPVKKITDNLGVSRNLYMRIPKPDIYKPIFAVFENYVIKALKGEDDSVTSRMVLSMLRGVKAATPISIVDHSDSILANLGGTIAQIAGGVPGTLGAELLSNQDFFRGRPIIPARLQNVPPVLQRHPWTPEAYVQIGNFLNISPLQIQHMTEGLGAGVGRIFVDLASSVTPQTPLPNDLLPIIARIDAEKNRFKAARKLQKDADVFSNNFIKRGFFMLGRGESLDPQSLEMVKNLDRTQNAKNIIESSILDGAQIEFENGNEAPLRTLFRSRSPTIRKQAEQRFKDIRAGLTRAEERLKRMNVNERTALIALQLLDNPNPNQLRINLRRKGIITREVDKVLTRVLRGGQTRDDIETMIRLEIIRGRK